MVDGVFYKDPCVVLGEVFLKVLFQGCFKQNNEGALGSILLSLLCYVTMVGDGIRCDYCEEVPS
jgi:hypothetical protein